MSTENQTESTQSNEKLYTIEVFLILPETRPFQIQLERPDEKKTQKEIDEFVDTLRSTIFDNKIVNIQLPLVDDQHLIMGKELLSKSFLIVDKLEVVPEED